MKEWLEKAGDVTNQKSMAEFVASLAEEYERNGAHWENGDLKSFLESMSAWIEDMDSYYKNSGQSYNENNISWKNLADILVASTIYE